MKRSEENILIALAGASGWTSPFALPDGNGRSGCARGDVMSAMKKAGLIEYGKEPGHSLYGYRITDAGRTAIAGIIGTRRRNMEPDAGQQWIAGLVGLSDDPLRRAAQIALAAIDRYISDDGYGNGTRLQAAYEALQAALTDSDT